VNILLWFRIPLIRIKGPLIIVQLIETTFLNLVNFARYVKKWPL